MKTIIVYFAIFAILLEGCFPSKTLRTQGGSTIYHSPTGQIVETKQSQNPQASSSQNFELTDTEDFLVPAGSQIITASVSTNTFGAQQTNKTYIALSAPTLMKKTHTEKQLSDIGAAQKDTLGETIAKLKSTTWWSVFGFMVFLAGVGLAFYPPATLIMGGKLPGIAIAVSGLIIASLPILLIGHENFILIGVVVTGVVALGIYYVHHAGKTSPVIISAENTLRNVIAPVVSTPKVDINGMQNSAQAAGSENLPLG